MRLPALVLLIAISSITGAYGQSLDQQERCAQRAGKSFQEIEAQNRAEQKQLGMTRMSGDYQSHYNTKLGKCLMLIETMDMIGPQFTTTAYVMDANERRVYATYIWMTREGKKFWEVPPSTCELIPSLKEKKFCSSREEFDVFVASYMEE